MFGRLEWFGQFWTHVRPNSLNAPVFWAYVGTLPVFHPGIATLCWLHVFKHFLVSAWMDQWEKWLRFVGVILKTSDGTGCFWLSCRSVWPIERVVSTDMLRLSVRRLGLRPTRPLCAMVAGHGQKVRTDAWHQVAWANGLAYGFVQCIVTRIS